MRRKVTISNMTREQVMVYVNFILEGHNVAQAIINFKSSRKYINDILDKVRLPEGPYYDEILANKIKLTLDKLLLEARAKAGSKSRRGKSISDEEAKEIIDIIINTGCTLEYLGNQYGCSGTTIAEAIKRVANPIELALIDKARMGNREIISEERHFKTQIGLLNDSSIVEEISSDDLDAIKGLYESGPRR